MVEDLELIVSRNVPDAPKDELSRQHMPGWLPSASEITFVAGGSGCEEAGRCVASQQKKPPTRMAQWLHRTNGLVGLCSPLPPPPAEGDAEAAEQRPDDDGGGLGDGGKGAR